MISLRARFLLAFAVSTVVPLAAVSIWARSAIVSRTEAEYARRLEASAAAAARRVQEREAEETRALRRLCERDFVVDRLLLDLATGRFGPERQEELVAFLPALARSLSLDTLEFVDDGAMAPGLVLASAHHPGRSGASDAALLQAADAAEGSFVRKVTVRESGTSREEVALLRSCVATRGHARVRIVGGRFLRTNYGGDLLGDVRPVRILLLEGKPSIPSVGREIHTFSDAEGRTAARLAAIIDEAPLREQLAELDRGVSIALAIALPCALLLGAILALRTTRPLRELELAARRVGEGDLDASLEVRYGGEIGRAMEAFNRMTAELRATREQLLRAERIAAWREIARRIAHEIKNPLSPIQVSIETMRKTYTARHPDFDEIFEESTLTILEEVERLKRIVTEFSRFARLPRPQPELLDLREVVEHVLSLPHEEGVEVHLTVGEAPRVRADRGQITQVLFNLVQNAAFAARSERRDGGARVDVELDRDERSGGARIAVRDNGAGMTEEVIAHLFEPYFTTKPGGTGLGLAIAQRVIEDHRGRIEVRSALGSGAEFVVRLPPEGPPAEAAGSHTDAALSVGSRGV